MDDALPTRRIPRWRLVTTTLALAGSVGCSAFPSHGTTAASFLRTVREDGDPNLRYDAYNKLASPNCYDDDRQKAEVVATLVAKLEQAKEPVATRAVICRTLGELRDPAAREALIKAVSDNEGVVRSHACRALGKLGVPDDATILARVMTVDTLEDCRIAAIDGIGALHSKDPRIVEVLLNGMDHEDPAVRFASLEALRKTTGLDYGVEPAAWQKALAARPIDAAATATARSATTPATATTAR